MNTAEAIAICKAWFAHNEDSRKRSVEMQRLAALARSGLDGWRKAQERMRQIDRSLTVYDGSRLEPAVRHLVERAAGHVPPALPEGK